MDWINFSTLVIVGFTACAEFGSYAFVHPIIRKLPAREHIQVEQGLVRTFGRVMPLLMPLCVIALIAQAVRLWPSGGTAQALAVLAALGSVVAITTTLLVNVPRNAAVMRWDPEHPPTDWKETRNKWEQFQGIRSWLFLAAFVLHTAAVLWFKGV